MAAKVVRLGQASLQKGQSRTPLLESEHFRAVLVNLAPGETIDLHSPGLDVVMAVLRGTGEIWVGRGPVAVTAGDVVGIPAGERRGVRAGKAGLHLLHVVSSGGPQGRPPEGETARTPWPPMDQGPKTLKERLHREHQDLLPHFGHLESLADQLVELDERDYLSRLRSVLSFLEEVLLPHARTEEDHLYPALDEVVRAAGRPTATMSADHEDISELVAQLRAALDSEPTREKRRAAQRALDRLAGLLALHFRKEEEVLFPLLDLLSPEETAKVEEAIATRAHHHHAE